MTRSKVAVLYTSPRTFVDDYQRLFALAGMREALPLGPRTSLRINISWHVYMPACSTTPWQLEAVIRGLLDAGHPAPSLFAYPAQSNFTGVKHPLEWIAAAPARGYRVLLDAAANGERVRLFEQQKCVGMGAELDRLFELPLNRQGRLVINKSEPFDQKLSFPAHATTLYSLCVILQSLPRKS